MPSFMWDAGQLGTLHLWMAQSSANTRPSWIHSSLVVQPHCLTGFYVVKYVQWCQWCLKTIEHYNSTVRLSQVYLERVSEATSCLRHCSLLCASLTENAPASMSFLGLSLLHECVVHESIGMNGYPIPSNRFSSSSQTLLFVPCCRCKHRQMLKMHREVPGVVGVSMSFNIFDVFCTSELAQPDRDSW